jgi:SpoIID/LytB domain protein
VRRPVAIAAVAALAAGMLTLPVLELPVAAAPAPQPVPAATTTLVLSGIDRAAAARAPQGPVVSEGAPALSATRLRTAVLTPETAVASADVLGITFASPPEAGTQVLVRVREHGFWSGWRALPVSPDGPDPSTAEGRQARTATEPLGLASASGVQVRIDTLSGRAPGGARAVVVDSGSAPADGATAAASGPVSTASAATARPTIITRAQWGADESRRTAGPGLTDTIKVGFVHHTTGNSSYTPAGAYEFMRALFDYYTTPTSQGGPGYSDMAYNFLVDRFGRLYEGRKGSIDAAVIGGHTAGFNLRSFAVAALGDTDKFADVSSVTNMIEPISRLMAYKLSPYGRNPLGWTTLTSNFGGGTSMYPPGAVANVRVISGHGEIGNTDCPGARLRSYLPKIRARTAAIMSASGAAVSFGKTAMSASTAPYASGGVTVATTTGHPTAWRLTVSSGCQSAVVRTLTGTQAAAGALSVGWNLRDAAGRPAPPGAYSLRLEGTTTDTHATVTPVTTSVSIAAVPGSPLPPCVTTPRVIGTDASTTSIVLGRYTRPTSPTVVLAPADPALLRFAAPAAVYASAKRSRLLLTPAGGLPAALVTELKANKPRTAVVVGPLSDRVVAQLVTLGVVVTSLRGSDPGVVAAAAARALRLPAARGAVYVSADDPALWRTALAAATAARTGRPLLFVRKNWVTLPTRTVRRELGITTGQLIAPVAAVPEAIRKAVGATRFASADAAATALALAGASRGAGTVVLAPPGASADILAAAALGASVLPVAAAGPTAGATSWLKAHGEVVRALAVVARTTTPDAPLVALGRFLADRAALPPIPSSFRVTGAGWGHGIGLSQSGAYGMAAEGATADKILTHYYTGTAVTGLADAFDLRVSVRQHVTGIRWRVAAAGASAPALDVALDGKVVATGTPADVFDAGMAAGKITVTKTSAGKAVVAGTGARLAVRWSGTRTPGKAGTVAGVLQLTSKGGSFSSPQRYRYGWLDVFASRGSTSTVEVVNPVRLHDEYLYGISEVPSSWPAAALQAQVVAARSFAAKNYAAGLRSACGCHVYTDTRDQNFTGYDKLAEGSWGAVWKRAVDATAVDATHGKVVTYHGTVIPAYYGDSTGGRTQNSEDVWGASAYPWARSVDDHWSTNPKYGGSFASWTPRVRSQAAMAAAFGLPNVSSVTVSKRFVSGAGAVFTARSQAGAVATMSGETFRSRLSLPSTYVRAVAGA